MVELALNELQVFKLQALDTKVKLERQAVVAQIEKKYAVSMALETQRALSQSVAVHVAEVELNAAVNQVVAELESTLGDGYAVKNLDWEKRQAVAEFDPAAHGKRLPTFNEPPTVPSTPDAIDAAIPQVAPTSVE